MLSASTRFQESTLESWVPGTHMVSGVNSGILGPGLSLKSQPWNLGPGTWFQASNQESWVRDGPGAVFKIQLWNLGSGHPFSGVNSGIFGPCTCFQESTPETRASDLPFSRPGFRSQLWNLGCGHPFSGVNSGILGAGTFLRESILNVECEHPFSGVNSGILGAWNAHGFRSQLWNLGPGLSLKSQPWNLGPGTWFQASNQESWVRELFSRFNSGILGPATRFQESTLESSVRAPAFRVNSGIFGSGPVFKTQLWNLGSGHPFSEVSSGILVFGPGLPFRSRHRFQKSTLESWIGAPVFRSQLWNFWSGTCFQEPTLVSWVWAPVSGSDSGFQESAPGILVGHLFSGVNSGILGPGT